MALVASTAAQHLLTLINAGQIYTINSSCAFRFGCRISLRINTLLVSTSVQSLFLLLKCLNHLFSCLIYSSNAVPVCLRQHILALISMDWTDAGTTSTASSAVPASVLASRHVLDRPSVRG